jgi:hypothetical protein
MLTGIWYTQKHAKRRGNSLAWSTESLLNNMTDEEIICEFMEPKPKYVSQGQPGWIEDDEWHNHHRWWNWFVDKNLNHTTRSLDLDALWEVEERLMPEQRLVYWLELAKGGTPETGYWRLLHAAPTPRIKALAAVIRSK